jgi:hypothetical protein
MGINSSLLPAVIFPPAFFSTDFPPSFVDGNKNVLGTVSAPATYAIKPPSGTVYLRYTGQDSNGFASYAYLPIAPGSSPAQVQIFTDYAAGLTAQIIRQDHTPMLGEATILMYPGS